MSTADLPARILAEIERIEQAAHLAINSLHPQEWDADLMKHPRGQYEARVNAGLNIKVTVETNPLSCDASDLARFIATNDPHTVLRRCAADRKTIDVLAEIVSGTYVDDGEPVLAEWMLGRLAASYGITVDGEA